MKKMKFSFLDSGVSRKEIIDMGGLLAPYLDGLRAFVARGGYDAPAASLNLPDDATIRRKVTALVARLQNPQLRYIFIIGIGGSNLGIRAVYEALRGPLGAYAENIPKLIFLDTNNAPLLRDALALLEEITSPEEFVVLLISKSGMTTEIIANFEIFFESAGLYIRGLTSDIKGRVAVITDESSKLLGAADAHGFGHLAVPKMVGGRYSVFSAIGLLPLALAGFDTEAFCAGARNAIESCLSEEIEENPALASAAAIFAQYEKGLAIHNTFFFNAELESVGKWYRQLVGESLGKDGKGIVPTVAIGSTDLHSLTQLYLDGPKNTMTTFVHALGFDSGIRVPDVLALPGLVPNIEEKDVHEIMRAILRGAQGAYRERGLPYLDIALDDISIASIGEFLQMKMIETMLLAKLLNINAFDQPAVEIYKIKTREILAQ